MALPDEDWVEPIAAAGQADALRFWSELEPEGRQRLQAELSALDLASLWDGFVAARSAESPSPASIGPVEVLGLDEAPSQAPRHRALGLDLLAEGGVGVVTVAGGQGTRLGFDGPKGRYPIGPVSGRTLFGIFAQRLRGQARRTGRSIPWWIMTSPATDAATRAYFEAEDFLGLAREDVHFVAQGTLPALDAEGRILLAAPDRLAMAPDGHGGLFAALLGSGALDAMDARGLRALFYHHVDNPLARLADPEYLGFHLERGAEMSCKAVEKRDPLENVGFLCRHRGRTEIVEYSELPETLAAARDASGRLVHWAGSIGIHVFETAFVRRVAEGPPLPLHLAHKRVPHVDDPDPTGPNAYKAERFVFDALARTTRVAVMETRRSAEYSPVKSAQGDASPAAARKALEGCYRAWIEQAGLRAPREGVRIEMDHARFDGPTDLERSGIRDLADAAPGIRLGEGAHE